LSGEVTISGAKNSALKLMSACVLAEGRSVLRNVPDIADVGIMSRLLEAMGLTVRRREDLALEVVRGAHVVAEAPYELVEQMRASTAVLGPLLAGRFGDDVRDRSTCTWRRWRRSARSSS